MASSRESVLMLGNSPQSAGLIITLGFGTGGAPPTPPVVTTPTETGAGRRTKRRTRYRIKLDDKEYAFDTLQEALAFIAQAKKAIPAISTEKAAELVSVGRRVGDARKTEAKSVTVVAAPSSTREIVQERIDEMDRLYWALVAKRVADIEDDDEEIWLLI